MRVQLVSHEQPDRLWVGINGLGDMGKKVGFRAPWAETGCHDLTTHDIEIGDQGERAVAHILKLAAFRTPTLHRFGFGDPFERLNAGHLITTDNMATQRVQQRRIGIHGTDGFDLRGKGERISRFGLGIQPVAAAVRL